MSHTMPRAIATDGVEFFADHWTYNQDQHDNELEQRTLLYSGVAGVAAGGVVTVSSGRTIAISGALKFVVNGLLGIISTPANILLGASDTWFIVAQYATSDDTPATFYGAGSPPFTKRHAAPVIVARNAGGGGAANSANDEVNLATVVVGVATVTTITDTRIIVPTVTNGSIALGGGATIDGVDPSAHVADIGDASHAAHVKLGAAGGAATFESVGAAIKYWIADLYIHNFGTSYIANESDFSSPPGGSVVATFQQPTLDGSFWREGFGPDWVLRLTLNFHSSASWTAAAKLLTVDDTVRVKLNGVDVYTQGSAVVNLNASVSLAILSGANVLKLYFVNGLDQYRFQFLTSLLNDNRITFDPM